MKNESHIQSSGANLRAASAKFILTGLIAAAASFAIPASSSAQISAFPFTLDGGFSGGGEWSDVTPSAFFSPGPGQSAVPSTIGGGANTLLYAAISHNILSNPGDLQLHLLYDFLPRTTAPLPGELFASITFPVTLHDQLSGLDRKDFISVLFRGAGAATLKGGAAGVAGGFFDIFVDLDINDPNSPLVPAAQIPGLLGATRPGPSILGPTPHLQVELEVSLRITPAQVTPGGPLPGGGINPATGLYDPDPVFWGAAGAGDGGTAGLIGQPLQSATAALIQINGDGSLTVTPTPEPSSALLLVGSLGMLAARRRKAAVAA